VVPATRYLGVAAVKATAIPSFVRFTGVKPNLAEVYTSFFTPLNAIHPRAIINQGALPLIQLNPHGLSLASITAGKFDSFLRQYSTKIRYLGQPIALSFAPEANGSWYPWGCRRTSAAAYIAAWRHVHDVMTAASHNRIIWVWDVNKTFHGACPLEQRWPGSSYVSWVAVDGYWREPGDTFANVLAPTIAAVHRFTSKPIIIAETGVPIVRQAPAWVRSVFAGAETTVGVIGIVWFNYYSRHGDYRLESDPAALTAFREAARAYRK
jgi:hypothetical protein